MAYKGESSVMESNRANIALSNDKDKVLLLVTAIKTQQKDNYDLSCGKEYAIAQVAERPSVSENSDNATIENKVYDELMGIDKYGCVKGYGFGVKAKEVSGTQSQNIGTTSVEELKIFYETKLENIKQSYETKLDGTQQNIVDLQEKLGYITSFLEKLVASHTTGNIGTSSNSPIECNQQVPRSSSSQI
ncbi:hypothetical protein GH714_013480 [Hevea brasiliensis]|uniref:Uncharacterized protein n=1 Tax=Hevea brasiliensis TaxID=3981 RepID=A0A6A6KR97_HEVBR|nr:hypothetical protein GH714_013480 [Hevea brasiliensis]